MRPRTHRQTDMQTRVTTVGPYISRCLRLTRNVMSISEGLSSIVVGGEIQTDGA